MAVTVAARLMCVILMSTLYAQNAGQAPKHRMPERLPENEMTRFEPVTSMANPVVRNLRRAVARGGLTDEGWCVVESFHLLEEALRSELSVRAVLASQSVKATVE